MSFLDDYDRARYNASLTNRAARDRATQEEITHLRENGLWMGDPPRDRAGSLAEVAPGTVFEQ